MKKNLATILSIALFLVVSSYCGQVQAAKDAYGWLLKHKTLQGYGITLIDTEDATSDNFQIKHSQEQQICAGAYADGKYYAFTLTGSYLLAPDALIAYDIETGTSSKIADYKDKALFNDMTFDILTHVMYALGDKGKSLLTLDINDGAIHKIADLEDEYLGLAANKQGELYAVSSKGMLVKLNKGTGSAIPIGSTGLSPYKSQSLEFDRDNDILYWSFYAFSGGGLYSVDTKSAVVKELSDWGFTQLVGLYIPYTPLTPGAPAQVSDFLLTEAPEGGLSVSLSWTNPSFTVEDEELTELTRIEIYRDDVQIHTIDNPQIGVSETWTDTNVPEGMHSYRIVPVNNINSGVYIVQNVFVGEDIPGIVERITLKKEGDNIFINWEEPIKGIHGGWYDKTSLTYNIIRMPEGKEIQTGLSGNSFIDKTIEALAIYTYKITASNIKGEGETATSEEIVAGSALQVPFNCTFTQEQRALWSIIDNNKDGVTWELSFTGADYGYSSDDDGDDWLISPPIHLSEGKYYQLNFDLTAATDYEERLIVTIGKGATVEEQKTILADILFTDTDESLRTFIVSVDTEEDYNLAFKAASEFDLLGFNLTNIELTEMLEIPDFTVLATLSGNTMSLSWTAPEAIEGIKYQIWRMPESKELSPDDWTLLTPNAITELTYKDMDWNTLISGNYQYIVKAIYPDGRESPYKFSNIVGMISTTINQAPVYLKVYPNPANDVLIIDGEYEEAQLVSISGMAIKTFNSVRTLNISDCFEGVYFLNIKQSTRIIKMKVIISR